MSVALVSFLYLIVAPWTCSSSLRWLALNTSRPTITPPFLVFGCPRHREYGRRVRVRSSPYLVSSCLAREVLLISKSAFRAPSDGGYGDRSDPIQSLHHHVLGSDYVNLLVENELR